MADPRLGADRFPTTRASAILGLRSNDADERTHSLELLTLAYWKPVYKYTRLKFRQSPHEAEDTTQEFFAKVVEKNLFKAYDPGRARFRTFLRACLDHFVADHERGRSAQKRGGGVEHLHLDFSDAESEIAKAEQPDAEAFDTFFDAEWTRHLLAMSVETLRSEFQAKGKSSGYRVFELYHLASAEPPQYAAVAGELGISVTDVTNRLSHARREFRRIVLETLRGITGSEEEFRSEARAVLGVLA